MMRRRMGDFFREVARAIAAGPLDNYAQNFLSSFRGMAPMVQTVHILAVSSVMGSIVLIDLRILGLALRGQLLSDLVRRLMPWTWFALPALALSGLPFVLARPLRYANNRVFGMKFAMLLGAVLLTIVLQRLLTHDEETWNRSPGRRIAARAVAASTLALWLLVMMAGRWIAYADYIFPPE
jgi:hypothetical protein